MPKPNTSDTLLSLLGMLAGGFGKGAMMAEMANDKDAIAKRDAEAKRKEALEDKAFEFLSQGYMDQTLPYGQRKKFGTALTKFYGRLAGTEEGEKVQTPGGFDYTSPYQMTPEENAREQMKNPATFRAVAKDMLAGGKEEDQFIDLKKQKYEFEIENLKKDLKTKDALIAQRLASAQTSEREKQILSALRIKRDSKFKQIELYKDRRGKLDVNKVDEWEPLLADIQMINLQIDDYLASDDGSIRRPIQGF